MKNLKLLYLSPALFLLLSGIYIVHARGGEEASYTGISTDISTAKGFGGQITNTKATRIDSLENSNYKCTVIGDTIEIKPVGEYPTSYFIPLLRQNGNPGVRIQNDEWILGTYSGKTTITCIYQGYPPTTQTVSLDTVEWYATSSPVSLSV